MGGQPFRDLGAAVAVEERAFPAALSRINYSFYKSPAEVGAWLAAQGTLTASLRRIGTATYRLLV